MAFTALPLRVWKQHAFYINPIHVYTEHTFYMSPNHVWTQHAFYINPIHLYTEHTFYMSPNHLWTQHTFYILPTHLWIGENLPSRPQGGLWTRGGAAWPAPTPPNTTQAFYTYTTNVCTVLLQESSRGAIKSKWASPTRAPPYNSATNPFPVHPSPPTHKHTHDHGQTEPSHTSPTTT